MCGPVSSMKSFHFQDLHKPPEILFFSIIVTSQFASNSFHAVTSPAGPAPRIIALFPNRGGLSTRDCKRKSSEYYKTNCNDKVCDQLGSHGRFN